MLKHNRREVDEGYEKIEREGRVTRRQRLRNAKPQPGWHHHESCPKRVRPDHDEDDHSPAQRSVGELHPEVRTGAEEEDSRKGSDEHCRREL